MQTDSNITWDLIFWEDRILKMYKDRPKVIRVYLVGRFGDTLHRMIRNGLQ